MIGKTISHYRVVSQLGVGGMGVVYAADDPRLGRQVALKFVPEDLAHDLNALERLRAEARTASSLNHPNICTIYDIGEHEGRPFIVMELLSGISLRDRIASRSLKVHEAVDVGIQVADALERAHGRSIVHRDIKPANLFLVDHGPVKVLDFGLAKMLPREVTADETSAPTIEHRTAAGIALGTIAYMSPEQVRGDTLDGRTDLFSLGAVLYECVTGHQPFKGKTSAMILASILTESPVAPVHLNPEVPPRLQDVINNCLEKDRELRCPDAAALRAELRRVRRDLESGAARLQPTVAVATNPRSGSGAVTQPTPVMHSSSAAVTTATAGRPAGRRTLAAVAAVLVVAGALLAYRWSAGRSSEPQPAAVSGLAAINPAAVAEVERLVGQAEGRLGARDYRGALAGAEAVLNADPANAAGLRTREAARDALTRLTLALRDGQRLLAAGDAEAANRALESARAMNPTSPEVAQLSEQLVEHFRFQARQAVRQAPPGARSGSERQAAAPAPAPAPAAARPSPSAPPPAASPVEAPPPAVGSSAPVTPPAAPVRPPVVEPPVAVAPPVARPEPPPPPPAAPTPSPVPDDDAAIRRLVATYARAIETKDLALFRSVKPNLTPEEQRRLTEGFRAVTSQQVNATVLSIERRGADATVRIQRRDAIIAAGRQQSTTSQQTLTVTQTNGSWVIRDIGR